VLDDVAERARLVVIPAAKLHAYFLGGRDLHRVDEVRVPHRLEYGVRESEREDVLDRLLAEVVVDPEDRVLVEDALENLVELACGLRIPAERLLDAEPVEAVARRERGGLQLLGDRLVRRRRRGAVVDAVAGRVPGAVELV